jgi:hypothetical protein
MNIGGHDLLITDRDGVSHGYVIATGRAENPVVHVKTSPNVPLPTSSTSPTQAGGIYDVRDSEHAKAIAHLDWTLGAGQRSLDTSDANASRFFASENMDISRPGELRLLRSVSDTAAVNVIGPVFTALGYTWMGESNGVLKYTADNGANWTTCTGITSTGSISGYATDGTKVFICIPSGAANSIYVNSAAAPGTFAKFGTDGTTSAIRHLAYSGGMLFAATAAKVAMVDSTTGIVSTSSSQMTPSFINSTMSSVALVNAGNAVFWVVSQGSRSFVYRITVDANAKTMYTEQYMEMPTGFIATCAIGYLSVVYVGGYYESATSGVGKGVVYIAADSHAAPLFEIGEYPENTLNPTSAENDNRIWALTSGSKDLFVLTNRAVYKWDIDDTGYSHQFDFPGTGASELVTSWNAGSSYSWDGTDDGGGAPSYQFPSGYTRTTSGTGTTTWSYAGGIATAAAATGTLTTIATGSPTGGEALSNTTGTTMQIVFGSAMSGGSSTGYVGYIRDGARQMKFAANCGPYSTSFVLALYEWDGSAWALTSSPAPMWKTGTKGVAHTVTVTLKGITATAQLDGGTALTTTKTKATTDAGEIKHEITTNAAGYATTVAIDSILLNSVGASASGEIVDALFRPSIAYTKGNLMAPYADASDAVSKSITSISVEAGATTIVTAAGHGITGSTQVVNISGSNSTPSIDGNRVATYLTADTFSLAVDVTIAGNTGTLKYNPSTGYSKTGTGVAASGSLTQSVTSFHSGSLLKDFRAIEVTHDAIPAGATVTMDWSIDGATGNSIGTTTGTHTVFPINQQGYSIQPRIMLTRDTTGTVSPVVRAVNVIWDFVKNEKHQYLLDCTSGAGDGRWNEDPEEAISFLFDSADEQATFYDRFKGSYTGTIDSVQFSQANRSKRGGYEGIVQVSIIED